MAKIPEIGDAYDWPTLHYVVLDVTNKHIVVYMWQLTMSGRNDFRIVSYSRQLWDSWIHPDEMKITKQGEME